jgi:hypothetical protein
LPLNCQAIYGRSYATLQAPVQTFPHPGSAEDEETPNSFLAKKSSHLLLFYSRRQYFCAGKTTVTSYSIHGTALADWPAAKLSLALTSTGFS